MKSRCLTLCATFFVIAGILAAWVSAAVAQTEPLNCDDWNTVDFFEVATADDVTACLEMGSDVHARSDDGHTPLHRAADVNASPAVLAVLLDAGADMQAQAAGDGHTPLHEASGNPELGMIEYLFLSGGDPEAQATDGATLLHYAAFSNQNPGVIDFLIANGADVNARRDDGIIPLHNAARNNGNPVIVERLLAEGAEVHALNDDGQTPLLIAAEFSESVAVIQALIDGGADPELVPDWGGSALHFAAASEYPEVTRFFIELGGVPNEQDDSGMTPLHIAARYSGNADVTRILIDAEADPNAMRAGQLTPLHDAARYNANEAVVEALIDAGADPNAMHTGQLTPLHDAARYNANEAVVEALIDAGADLSVNSSALGTPLYAAAAENDNPAVVEALIGAGADLNAGLPHLRPPYSSPLYAAAASNDNPAVIDVILRAGVDVNGGIIEELTGGYARLALHSAVAENDNPEVIEMLLRAGADPYLEDGQGTALHVAALTSSRNMVRVMQMLIDAGMDSNVQDRHGDTPLTYVGRPDSAEFLLANGADPRWRDEDGNTVLHRPGVSWEWVTEESDEIMSLVSLLAAAGADVNARNENGETPLHLVRNAEQANALLTQGADPRHRDMSGNTALHKALGWFGLDSEEALELVALLVNAGGDVNARNENGRTPIHDVNEPAGVNALLAHGANINAQDEEGNTRLHLAAGCEFLCFDASELVIALLDAGADATIRNAQGQTPWDLANANEDEEFSGSDGYWQLNDARFNAPSTRNFGTNPGAAVSLPPSTISGSPPLGGANGPCEIPGFYDDDVMMESVIENLRLSWCPLDSSSQRRFFALQAELAWCRLNAEPPLENMSEFLQASRSTCASLAALDEQARTATGGFVIGDETPAPYARCRCPAHYFQ